MKATAGTAPEPYIINSETPPTPTRLKYACPLEGVEQLKAPATSGTLTLTSRLEASLDNGNRGSAFSETYARTSLRLASMIFDKLKKLDIVFDSPELDCPPVFSNGDVVSGRVVLDLSGESRVDSLKLHAEGFAKVHWTESRSAGSSTAYTQNYSDEVEYLNRREVLLQAGQSAVQELRRGSWQGVRDLGGLSATHSDGNLVERTSRLVVCVCRLWEGVVLM